MLFFGLFCLFSVKYRPESIQLTAQFHATNYYLKTNSNEHASKIQQKTWFLSSTMCLRKSISENLSFACNHSYFVIFWLSLCNDVTCPTGSSNLIFFTMF